MKLKTRQITVTAILLAICIVSQFFKNLNVYIIPDHQCRSDFNHGIRWSGLWHHFKRDHSNHFLFHHRKPDYGSHSCNVPMYYDWKYHSRSGSCPAPQ